MTRMNERGLTLVEVLAVVVISAIIGTIAYAVLFSGMQTNERVKVESQLRDEADLIMTWLIQDFYTLKQSDLKEKHLPKINTNDYYLETNSGKLIGFINGKAFNNDGEIKLNDQVKLDGSMIEEVADGQFKIILVLKEEKTGQKLELTSEIGIIRNSNAEEG